MKKLSWSLQKKTVIVFAVAMLLLGVLCTFSYRYYYDSFYRTAGEALWTTMNTNTRQVSNLIGSIENAIDIVNDNDSALIRCDGREKMEMILSEFAAWIVQTEIAEDHSNLYEFVLDNNEKQGNFENLFDTVLNVTGENITKKLLVSEEYSVAKYMPTWNGMYSLTFVSDRGMNESWFQNTQDRAGEIYWFQRDEYPNRLFCAKCLTYRELDRLSGRLETKKLGTVVLSFDTSWILEQINTSDITSETIISLVWDEGNIFLGGNHLSETQEKAAIQMKDWESGEKNCAGMKYMVQREQVGTGLTMVTAIPINDLKIMTFQMMRLQLLIMLVVLAVLLLLMFLLHKVIIRPLMRLSEQMNKGVVELIDERGSGQDEIGLLYKRYNQMQQKIQNLLAEAWDSAQKQKVAEIHALQVQINPHFVFNTLGTVSSYALLNGQDEIARMLTQLSFIMRYNTYNPDSQVLLKDEIEMIQKYEEIQQMSYDGAIYFRHEIEPKCESFLIPKLIIQPLVENAIVHGIDLRKGNAEILISVCMQEECLIIKVVDSGTGLDAEKMNRYIHEEEKPDGDSYSLGVRNVYDRIKLVFGETGNLYYAVNENGNTEAVITIRLKDYYIEKVK